jgi:hypothetical protein
VLHRIPNGKRESAAGDEDATRLAERRRRVGHQHVAPAAQDGVDAGQRQVDPFAVQHAELDVGESELQCSFASAVEHRLCLVGDHHAAAWSDELGGEHARLPHAAGELEHALPRLQRERVEHAV